jgi:hypothetical protein
MRTHTMTRNQPGCEESTFTGVEPSILQSKSRHFPTARGQHRSFVSRPQTAPRLRNEGAEIPTGIDGLSVPLRLQIPDRSGHPVLRDTPSNWLQVRLGCFRLSPACPFRLLHTLLLSRPAMHYPVADILAEVQSRFVFDETDLHSLLSTVVVKLIDTMGALPLQHRAPST